MRQTSFSSNLSVRRAVGKMENYIIHSEERNP